MALFEILYFLCPIWSLWRVKRKLSWFMISKWFLVQLWCFIGAWQIFMLKVSLSTQKTAQNVNLSFPDTTCPIQPNLAETILICQFDCMLLCLTSFLSHLTADFSWIGLEPLHALSHSYKRRVMSVFAARNSNIINSSGTHQDLGSKFCCLYSSRSSMFM